MYIYCKSVAGDFKNQIGRSSDDIENKSEYLFVTKIGCGLDKQRLSHMIVFVHWFHTYTVKSTLFAYRNRNSDFTSKIITYMERSASVGIDPAPVLLPL